MLEIVVAGVPAAVADRHGGRQIERVEGIDGADVAAAVGDIAERKRIAAVTHLLGDASVSPVPEKARGLNITRGGAEDVLHYDPDLVLAGMEAHVCLGQTALDLAAAGYRVFVVSDATASRTRLDHETALHRMAQEGVHVVTAERVVGAWLRDAGRAAEPVFESMR